MNTVPGSGIVMPGGANIYYLDFAPGAQNPMVRLHGPTFSKTTSRSLSLSDTNIDQLVPLFRFVYFGPWNVDEGGQQHRTLSTDYVVVIKGTLTVLAPPPESFDVTEDGKGSYTEMVEAVAREGDIVVQRGSLHT